MFYLLYNHRTVKDTVVRSKVENSVCHTQPLPPEPRGSAPLLLDSVLSVASEL